MSERNFNVQFKECSISFIVPISKITCGTRGLVKTMAKTFASLRDYSKQDEEKYEYDCMRIVFEYADAHAATWCELAPMGDSAVVTLYFVDTARMVKFQEAVESLTVK